MLLLLQYLCLKEALLSVRNNSCNNALITLYNLIFLTNVKNISSSSRQNFYPCWGFEMVVGFLFEPKCSRYKALLVAVVSNDKHTEWLVIVEGSNFYGHDFYGNIELDNSIGVISNTLQKDCNRIRWES